MNEKNIRPVDDYELEPEYDLSKMRVIKRGAGYATKNAQDETSPQATTLVERKISIMLDDDVAAFFNNTQAVNEALRTFVRVMRPSQ